MFGPPNCRQYNPGDFRDIGPLNWNEIVDEDDDNDENWADPGALSGALSLPSDGKDNDDSKGAEDTQGSDKETAESKGAMDKKGTWKETEDGKWLRNGTGKGKGNGNRNRNGQGKGIVI
jgi:hypothetical protein